METAKLLDGILKKYTSPSENIIAILQEIQNLYGYLPKDALIALSSKTKIPLAKIYGISTFYAQFRFIPPGKHTLRVCLGTACHVKGGNEILNTIMNELKINIGEVTRDSNFHLERVACIGCCALAPVVVIDGNVYPKMTPEKVKEVLEKYE